MPANIFLHCQLQLHCRVSTSRASSNFTLFPFALNPNVNFDVTWTFAAFLHRHRQHTQLCTENRREGAQGTAD